MTLLAGRGWIRISNFEKTTFPSHFIQVRNELYKIRDFLMNISKITHR